MKENNTVAAERLKSFFDAGTFVEIGAYISRSGTAGDAEGVVCGYGSISGRLIFAFAQDSSLMKGALDGRHADKILRTYEKALAVGAPVVGFFDCAGAVVFDGAAALAGYGKLLSAVSAASGVIPQIAVINGTCAGTMAAVAALFDFTVVIKGASRLYVGSPTQLGDEVGTAEAAFAAGEAALIAENGADALAKAKALLAYLPDHAEHGTPAMESVDDPNRLVGLADRTTAAEALAAVVDAGSFLELYAGYGEAVKCGLAGFGGASAAVLAIDGELDLASIEKMTRSLDFADAMDLPTVTLVNCKGVKSDAASDAAMAAALAKLAKTLAEGTAPRVTAIVGEAIGAGFIFGGSRALGADMVYALPGTEIAALSARSAVAFLWNDRITPALSREALEEEWRNTNATPEAAAATGEVDDVIAPAELRARLIAALFMLVD